MLAGGGFVMSVYYNLLEYYFTLVKLNSRTSFVGFCIIEKDDLKT